MKPSEEWLASRLEQLQRVSTEMTRAVTVEEVALTLMELLDAPGVSVTRGLWLYRPEIASLELLAQMGMPVDAVDGFERVSADADVPVAVAHRERRTIQMTSRTQSEQEFGGLVGASRVTQGFVAVPLVVEGVSLGAISLGYDDQPSVEEVLFLEAIVGQAAQAVVRVRLTEREQRRRAELEFLMVLSEAALEAGDHTELMRNVTRAAVPTLGDWCAVHFLPEDGGPPEVVVAHVDPAKVSWAEELQSRHPFDPEGTTGVPSVVRSGETELLQATDTDVIDEAIANSPIEEAEVRAILAELQLTSALTVPMRTKRRLVGAMQFVSAESGREYDEADVALAEIVADRLAEPLDSAWVNDQQREFAGILQRSLLPPRLPILPGIDLSVCYLPAGPSAVGGDFYDVFAIDERSWAVVIGDCCGVGPNAAALSSIARHTVRAAARHGLSHPDVVDWLNQAIALSDRDLFCTACYATLTRADATWTLQSAAAGHPLPIVSRRDGVATIGSPGTLLGVFREAPIEIGRADLEPDDLVVFYTDGVTDLPPPYGLTAEALADLVHGMRHLASAQEIAEQIEASIRERVSDPYRADDVALVVLRVLKP